MFRSRSSDSTKSTSTPPSSPSSPRKTSLNMPDVANILIRIRRVSQKSTDVECSSGPELQTHPGISEGSRSPRKECLERKDVYECSGAVVTSHLLRATRTALVKKAEDLGANALVDEQWKCSIRGPNHGVYRAEVQYKASATMSSNPDPHRPVSLDRATQVPVDGLMTIIRRQSS